MFPAFIIFACVHLRSQNYLGYIYAYNDLVFKAFEIVHEHGEWMVPGFANPNGNRYNEEGTLIWGGRRVKSYKIDDEVWLEPGTFEVQEERKEFTKSRYLEPDVTDHLVITY